MREPDPVIAVELFPDERSHLTALLDQLSEDEWARPTVCDGWSVKDVALHILGGDIGNISRRRDGHRAGVAPGQTWDDLVVFLNEWNSAWVEAARRISARLLIDLLKFTGPQLYDHFHSLDPFQLGGPVSWAGPQPAPVWLDIAREYTERWLHQQHIRQAVDRAGLKGPRFFAPVIATFVRALPHAYRNVTAAAGAHVRLVVSGDAGGSWSLLRDQDAWRLYVEVPGPAGTTVRIDQETAWRLFTKGIAKDEAARSAAFEGDRALGLPVLDAVAILA